MRRTPTKRTAAPLCQNVESERNMNSTDAKSKLVIREIEPPDAPTVSALVSQLGYARTAQQILDWIASVNPQQQAAFVACVDGKVAGWIEVSIERRLQSAPFALIGGLVVAEGARGQGIGRELCRFAEQWSQRHGVAGIRVTSRSTRVDAHRFYMRDGYRVVKTSLVFEKGCCE
jgi:predicted N-acetyltransferase YhbS